MWRAGSAFLVLGIIGCGESTSPPQLRRITELSAISCHAAGFVAVGARFWADQYVIPLSETTLTLHSDNGLLWETGAPTAAGWLHAVTRGGDNLVTMGSYDGLGYSPDGTTPVVFLSNDAITWQSITGPTLQWRSVSHGPGGFLALGIDPRSLRYRLVTSPDGQAWTEQFETNMVEPRSVAGSDRFVLWSETPFVAMSTNVDDWQIVALDSVTSLSGMAFLDGQFVAGGSFDPSWGEEPNSTRYFDLTSSDGVSWVIHPRQSPRHALSAFAAGGGQLVAIGGSTVFAFDRVRSTWRPVHEGLSPLLDICHHGGRFVAVGRTILTSTDGEHWSETPLP